MRSTSFALTLAVLLATARPARADEWAQTGVGTGVIWGLVAAEVLAATAATLRLTVDEVGRNRGLEVAVLTLPFALAAGVGALAGWQRWPMAVPRATHGALWTGFDLFLAGSLAHGAMRPESQGMAIGPLSWSMAAAGAGFGAAWGATQISNGDDLSLWMVAPYAGGMAALVSSGVLVFAGWLGGWSSRSTMQAMGWTSFGLLTTGLGAAYAAPWIVEATGGTRGSMTLNLSEAASLGAFEPLPTPRFGAFAPGR